MKKYLYHLIIPLLLCLPSAATAQYFEADNFAFNILSAAEHTVEVTQKCNPYWGNLTIPAQVTYEGITYDVVSLGEYAFSNASLAAIRIPSSITQIKRECFISAKRLASIDIPASVTNIEFLALGGLDLTTINVDENNPNYRSIDGMLFTKDSSLMIQCPQKKTGAIAIPQNTKSINHYAFYNCQLLTNISLPDGLTSIGLRTFEFCKRLYSVTIPASVTYLGTDLFGGCSSLNNLTLEEGNTQYYMDGIVIYSADGDTLISYHKSADSVYLPNTLRVVAGFSGNSDIKYVNIPGGVTTIEDEAFAYSSLERIDCPNFMTAIGSFAFRSCETLTHVNMPNTLESLGNVCFFKCSNLTSIDIPNGLLTIPENAFMYCSALSQVSWGDAVETIETQAFIFCNFTELHFPPTLRTLRSNSFSRDITGRLESVTFSAPIDTIEAFTFTGQRIGKLQLKNNLPPVVTIVDGYGFVPSSGYVDSVIIPCGSLDAYLADDYWKLFVNKLHEDCNIIATSSCDKTSIYPNPATDRLTVVMAEDCHTIEVTNPLGQIILTVEATNGTTTIDVSTLKRGPYLLRLHAHSGGSITKKILLQ